MGTLVHGQDDRVGSWVAQRVEQSASWGAFRAFGMERDGELVAGVVVNNYNGSNATCHIAVDRPGKDMLALFNVVCDYAFNHCGLHRLTGLVPSDKPKVLRFDLRIGFELEFVMKRAAPGGADMNVLVMWRETCPWLPRSSR